MSASVSYAALPVPRQVLRHHHQQRRQVLGLGVSDEVLLLHHLGQVPGEDGPGGLALEGGQVVLEVVVGGGLGLEVGVDLGDLLGDDLGDGLETLLDGVLGGLPLEAGDVLPRVLGADLEVLEELGPVVLQHLREVGHHLPHHRLCERVQLRQVIRQSHQLIQRPHLQVRDGELVVRRLRCRRSTKTLPRILLRPRGRDQPDVAHPLLLGCSRSSPCTGGNEAASSLL